jgi:hypothetical protein
LKTELEAGPSNLLGEAREDLRLRPTAASDLPAGFEVTEAGGLIGAA